VRGCTFLLLVAAFVVLVAALVAALVALVAALVAAYFTKPHMFLYLLL
jgi:hypothetical protein